MYSRGSGVRPAGDRSNANTWNLISEPGGFSLSCIRVWEGCNSALPLPENKIMARLPENIENEFYDFGDEMEHSLRSPSSYIVVVLRSLRHGACVRCRTKIHSLEESLRHWDNHLAMAARKKIKARQPNLLLFS
jgi:hypothetical protein